MALDDKVFRSAIAKINKIKAKQTLIPQIQVFEDPPHLKKEITNSNLHPNTPQEVINSFETKTTIIHKNILSNSIVEETHNRTENDKNLDHVQSNSENPIYKNNEKYDTNRGTEYSTIKGTKKGTEQIINQNWVQDNGTNSNTIISTKRSTEIGFNLNKTTSSILEKYPDFIYRRPYDSLTGIPKKIVDVIFEICRKYGMRETPPFPFAMLVRLCNEKKNSVKVTRQRLLDEEIIMTKKPPHAHAKGRSGMLIYKLREDIFDEINDSLSLLIRGNNSSQNKGTKYSTGRGTKAPSSSSDYNKTTTTDLPDEWKKINVTPLKVINFGILEIKNIFRKCPQHITHDVVQDSIYQFAYGIENNPERYKNMNAPSGILVKSLCEGNLWTENGYISPEEKLKAEKENRITLIIEQQFKEPKFLDWFNTLDESKKESLVSQGVKSSTSYMISKAVIQKEHAYKYFEHEIWPEILEKFKIEMI